MQAGRSLLANKTELKDGTMSGRSLYDSHVPCAIETWRVSFKQSVLHFGRGLYIIK